MSTPAVALSVKQPWAALIVAGRKTVEVRRWATARRGRVVIHAARVPDDRPEAWRWVTDDLVPAARLAGGLVGVAEVVDCLAYTDPGVFLRDTHRHLNDPDWFAPPTYGFVLAGARPVPFVRLAGNIKFFEVPDPERPA